MMFVSIDPDLADHHPAKRLASPIPCCHAAMLVYKVKRIDASPGTPPTSALHAKRPEPLTQRPGKEEGQLPRSTATTYKGTRQERYGEIATLR